MSPRHSKTRVASNQPKCSLQLGEPFPLHVRRRLGKKDEEETKMLVENQSTKEIHKGERTFVDPYLGGIDEGSVGDHRRTVVMGPKLIMRFETDTLDTAGGVEN